MFLHMAYFLAAVAFGLVISYLISRLTSLNLPYTVLIFCLGFVISSIISTEDVNEDNKFITLLEKLTELISGEGLLLVFLPPLLFAEIINLNIYHVKVAFVPSTLLAFPGAAFAAFLQVIKIYIPYQYSRLIMS